MAFRLQIMHFLSKGHCNIPSTVVDLNCAALMPYSYKAVNNWDGRQMHFCPKTLLLHALG